MIAFTRFNSLKAKLIVYFTAVTILLNISISVFYYYNEKNSLEMNMIDNSYKSIGYLLNNIEKQLKLCENLSDWVYVNRFLGKVLMRDYSSPGNSYSIDIPAVQKLIDDRLSSSSIGKYIDSFIVMGDNGIYLSAGNDSDWIDRAAIRNTAWFKEGMEKNGRVYWNDIIENPADPRQDEYILPLVRPVIFADTYSTIGWSMIGFKPALISDVFENYELEPGQLLFVLDGSGKCIYHSGGPYTGKPLTQYRFIDDILRNESGHFTAEINNTKMLVCFMKSRYSRMTLVQALSYEQIGKQRQVIGNITIAVLLLSVAISAAFTVFLSSRLTKPLRNVLRKMKSISSGNFERDASLEGTDEMGILGKGINEMAGNINELMNKLLEKENEKKKLELKMLQSQINPHFIYNTLNSIKLMATIQGSEGISETVSSLGLLLKEISKGTSEKITLREEIALVDSYIYIQKNRYKGMIKVQYQIRDEELLGCKILKFTLQPVIENAIFHGFESKKGIGIIKIDISAENGTVVICIEDNGVGMTSEKIQEIFTGVRAKGIAEFNSIGIKNVDERLKLTYGDMYGLRIESRQGEYTKVYVTIPMEW